jgi:carbamoyl-phosphate synthase small subunit
MNAALALEDGRVFRGTSFAAEGISAGEIVFNTSMTGYQEISTDPSYHGQIVAMTYPLIGNYGVNDEDVESDGPKVAGFVVREHCRAPSNWRSKGTFGEWLTSHGIVAVEGIDTRALTKHIRTGGAKRSCLAAGDWSDADLIEKAKAWPGLVGRDLVKEVTCSKPYAWSTGSIPSAFEPGIRNPKPGTALPRHVVAYDFGAKRSILKCLVDAGCRVTVVPASTTAEAALALKPDGIFLSNGPGDPEGVPYAIEAARGLVGKLPVFGICLGHQILGLAFGGRTYKLKFGHRGANQPVKDLTTGKVEITSQNHGFCVDIDTLDPGQIETTHVNLNDGTSEGLRHKRLPVFSVQHHPEASPGPHDARHLFGRFAQMMADPRPDLELRS